MPQGSQSLSFTCLFFNKSGKGRQTPHWQMNVSLKWSYKPPYWPRNAQPPRHPPLCFRAVLHQTEGIGAITPAYLKPPKCVEQVAHNALLLLFGSRSQDGRFHNAFKWHITGRSLAGLPRTISPGAKVEQQAAAPYLFNKEKEEGGCLEMHSVA